MKKILCLIIAVAGLALGLFVLPSVTGGTTPSFDDNLKTEIAKITELNVIKYKYKTVETDVVTKQLAEKYDLPFTKKSIVMLYSDEFDLGVDASRIKVHSTTSGGAISEVTVSLPDIEVLNEGSSVNGEIDFPIQKDTIFNKISANDTNKLKEVAYKNALAQLQKDGVYDSAKEELEITIANVLHGICGKDTKVTFK